MTVFVNERLQLLLISFKILF